MITIRSSTLGAIVLASILCPSIGSAAPSVIFRGYTLTELYTFEDAAAEQHQQLYQTLSFRIERPGTQKLSLVGHMRYQGDSSDDFAESGSLKIHNLYARWADGRRFDLRLGRQFLAEGVGFGTYDAVRLSFSPVTWGSATFWGGQTAPSDREANIRNLDDAKSLGLALRGCLSKVNLTASLLMEDRGGDPFRRRAGLSANADLTKGLYAHGLFYINISGPSDLHRARLLLRYNANARWRLFGEFAAGTPQLPVDSPFEFVEIETSMLGRLGASYQLTSKYWVGMRVQSFLSGVPSSTFGLSIESGWGSLGYRQRFGDFGDESGLFGSIRVNPTDFAQVYASAEFSAYQFEDRDQEDQTAAQVGVRLFPVKSLLLDASLQALKNEQFDQDIRGLLRIKWSFAN
ncbi:MAG TPA: hypothetical protein VF398_02235 [bacterium]